MRHGDSDEGLYDDIRPLSRTGTREAEAAGEFFKFTKEIPDIIYHSTLLRSRQTANLAAVSMGFDGVICEHEGLLPDDPITSFEDMMPANLKGDILVVGNLPFLWNLASYLLTGSDGALGIRFKTGCIICLERSSVLRDWNLRYFITPKLMEALLKKAKS